MASKSSTNNKAASKSLASNSRSSSAKATKVNSKHVIKKSEPKVKNLSKRVKGGHLVKNIAQDFVDVSDMLEEEDDEEQEEEKVEDAQEDIRDEDQEDEEDVKMKDSESPAEETESSIFADLNISPSTKSALAQMELSIMTEIQAKILPSLLSGRDVFAVADAGAGKTIAYLLSVVEKLSTLNFQNGDGTGTIILAPTRESAHQIQSILSELAANHAQSFAVILEGSNLRSEAEKLQKGVNIVIATPDRLLQHLKTTEGFVYNNLNTLIIDQIDLIIDNRFEPIIQEILDILPAKRQGIVIATSNNKEIKSLAQVVLRAKYARVDISSRDNSAIEGVEQGYVVCESDKRFLVLNSFLKKSVGRKVVVFLSSCNMVTFYGELLSYLEHPVPVFELNGNQTQQERTIAFAEFCATNVGVLFTTDVVMRGIELPSVDFVLQFDPPTNAKDYIQRVIKVSKNENQDCKSVMFLLPSEVRFLEYFKQYNISLDQYDFASNRVSNVQSQLEKYMVTVYHLNQSSKNAYRSYLQSYANQSLKQVYNISKLDLVKVAKAFGFTVPPKINIDFSTKKVKQALKEILLKKQEESDAKKAIVEKLQNKAKSAITRRREEKLQAIVAEKLANKKANKRVGKRVGKARK
ncbi:P-loop containing nucleoside triphosphate hydrolase protein [Nadsonia fulvescens var. elongata DSM 6958]|uniref:ATP-dependent RNA helicase n=1 Tax=Nadsonia fulvescens var. elongata DSM 6958 TaxID=857566 RepID=A0A1E3PEV3_9ASCO|nr:P-loop containing nucleoside triphosphate hydrolase protein [Nadsonia fulvescens var. elongata DSM 6958]